jgi:hypothetical protein
MLEGLAVWDETRYTHAGRGRSPFYDMIIRAAVESDVLNDPKFITLDKINAPNPYWPYGETWYLFGYELMNDISEHGARQSNLGALSYRSGGRVPYFINGNLENITGKDFYQFWDQFVDESKVHAGKQLSEIKREPLTPFQPLTDEGGDREGASASPDGQWLAFTRLTPDDRSGFFLMNRPKDGKPGEVKRIVDNVLGAASSFTPDSKAVIFSSLRRTGEYYLMSDLQIYDLEKNRRYWLTDRLRAKDPNITRDAAGKLWVTFTITESSKTGVAIAPLLHEDGDYKLGEVQKIFDAKQYDRASTPKFSPPLSGNATTVVFTLHRNGKLGEDLVSIKKGAAHETTLLSDGSFNRYPAIAPNGQIYFISDKTGVDNLYRLTATGSAERVTNVTTGLAFPSFGPGTGTGELLVNTYSYKGWDLSSLPVSKLRHYGANAKVEPPAAPPVQADATSNADSEVFPVKDYSVWPSILPREWAPYGYAAQNEYYLGAEILGFDATGRHQYLVSGAYDTLTKKPDLLALYQNFQLGVELDTFANIYTDAAFINSGTLLGYDRRIRYSETASYPFLWTFSSLTPSISYNVDRTSEYIVGTNPPGTFLYYQNTFVPHIDGFITYTDTETSNLAVTPEAGRTAQFGARQYLTLSQSVTKFVASDVEHFRLVDHLVFSPYGYISWATSFSPYAPADVLTQGRQKRILNPFAVTDLDQIPLHGYQNQSLYTRIAEIYGGQFTFPLARIFRGWGTNPAFLNNLYGFAYGETAVMPNDDYGEKLLPASGGGMTLTGIAFLQVPLSLTVEFDHGFKKDVGGDNEIYFELGIPSLSL